MSIHIELPPDLHQKTIATLSYSFIQGAKNRKQRLLWIAILLLGAILILWFLKVPTSIFIATIIAIATLCLIYVIESVALMINAQFDAMDLVIKYYAEQKRNQN